jgi:hypothetical protein
VVRGHPPALMRPNEGCRRAGSAAARPDGAGAVLTALLLLIPRTSSLGILLATAFWGGAICIHMAHGEPYIFQAAMLVLSWAGAYLRDPATLSSFSARIPRGARAESAPAVP